MIEPHSIRRILLIKLSALGDIVMTLPLLPAIQNRFPQAKIDWLVNKSFQDLLKNQKYLHQILLFQRKEWGRKSFWKNRQTFFQLLRDLKNSHYDLVLDFQGLLRSGFLAFCTHAPQRVGFANAREMAPLFYTHKVSVPTLDVHAFDRYQSLVESVGVTVSHPPIYEIPLEEEAIQFVEKHLSGYPPPFVGIVPQTMWKTKIWGTEKLIEVLKKISPFVTPVLFGSADGAEEAEQLQSACAGKAINLIGKTNLSQLFAFLHRMNVVLTNDSGPMHMAATLKVPVVAIFGPTNPIRTGPFLWAPQKIFHATDQVACAPCYRRVCPTQLECMAAVSPQAVSDYLLHTLDSFYETKKT